MITAIEWAKPVSMLPFGVLRLRMQENQLSVCSLRLSSCCTGAISVRPGGCTGSGFAAADFESKTTFDRQTLRGSAANHHCGLPSPPGEYSVPFVPRMIV